jgi:peptidoglycan hydrolase FlgJ
MPIRSITEVLSHPPAKVDDQKKIDEDKLKKTCMDFESIFIQHLLKSMRQTIPQSGVFGESSQKNLFQSFFDQELSRNLANQRGLGIGKMLFDQMRKKREESSPFPSKESVSKPSAEE